MPLNLVGYSQVARLTPIACEPPMYYEASWKGVPFHVEATSDEFGRRGDVYEYPLGDNNSYKDLGKRAARFKVEGFLIGTYQQALSRQMARAAESPEPGSLVHPLYGSLLVACVTCTVSADYRREKKRTKLSFEFVEAQPSIAPFIGGVAINYVWLAADAAVRAAFAAGALVWDASPTATDIVMLEDIAAKLASLIIPIDEDSYDARDMLGRFAEQPPTNIRVADPHMARMVVLTPAAWQPTKTFASVGAPIDYASATIARIHKDALERLKDFNAYVVNRSEATPTAQALILTTRLIMIRDYAVAAARKAYDTIKAALDDLDFIMQVYDDEERAATRNCDDVLVSLIYKARGAASSAILVRNIRLPGIAEFPIVGVWPSLVAAHKLYADGRRHEQVEAYNPTMLPFFMGRDVVAPTR